MFPHDTCLLFESLWEKSASRKSPILDFFFFSRWEGHLGPDRSQTNYIILSFLKLIILSASCPICTFICFLRTLSLTIQGFPGGANGKEPTCQCRRHKKCRLDPWVGKILWRRACQPTPVSLPGESHEQRSLAATAHRITKNRTWLKRLSTAHTAQCATHTNEGLHMSIFGTWMKTMVKSI